MSEMPGIIDVPCLCFGPSDDGSGCICGDSERVLRHAVRGRANLTSEQREWALQQIESVEGYHRVDHENESDVDLANTTLSAWTDFCRDKGLL